MTNDRGMTCGNCAHYQEDKHCALYPRGETTEPDFVAVQQLYCDWKWKEDMSSVAEQFARILEEQARHIRDTEDEILLLMKIDGIGTVIEDLIDAIIIDCKDEHLLDESGDS